MKITEKDVGRVAIDCDGGEWTIIALVPYLECPVVGVCGSWTDRFKTDGNALKATYNLIRFADEPESKPPPETVTITFSDHGAPYVSALNDRIALLHPHLARQNFTYRLEKK